MTLTWKKQYKTLASWQACQAPRSIMSQRCFGNNSLALPHYCCYRCHANLLRLLAPFRMRPSCCYRSVACFVLALPPSRMPLYYRSLAASNCSFLITYFRYLVSLVTPLLHVSYRCHLPLACLLAAVRFYHGLPAVFFGKLSRATQPLPTLTLAQQRQRTIETQEIM